MSNFNLNHTAAELKFELKQTFLIYGKKFSLVCYAPMLGLASLFIGPNGIHPLTSPAQAAKPALTLNQKFLAMEQSFEKEFEDFFGEDLAEVTEDPEDVANTLQKISEESGIKPGVLWVVPRDDHLHLVLILPGGKPVVRDLYDVPREKLLKTVDTFQNQINNPNIKWDLKLAQRLYRWLIAPFDIDHLQVAEIDTLLFCLGNGLRGLPLAALHDGNSYLVERYSLTNIPAFNLIQSEYTARKKDKILAGGASEFLQMEDLPSVPTEISSILIYLQTRLPNYAQWKGEALLNRNFTINNLKSQLKKQTYDVVHLATHAEFNPGNPRQSFIQFKDEKLRLDQMNTIDWSQPRLDLLVLSACKTALGNHTAELGFAGIALKSGVKTALGSLWYVSDVGTLAIMSEFYQQLPQSKTKADALRQAQLQMLRGQIRIEERKLILSNVPVLLPSEVSELAETDFSHPFYWSGFTMLSSPW